MSSKLTSVDEYIGHLQIWREEVTLLREIVLSTGLTETIKWGGPCYQWQQNNVVGLAAFKSYTGIWFFQGGLLDDKQQFLMNAQEGKTKAMRQWRFFSKNEILNAPIREYIFESIENFRIGKKIVATAKDKVVILPQLLQSTLDADAGLYEKWLLFSPSSQREFAEYISEAKRDTTRKDRLQKVLELIGENKNLHDKYKK
ncbi:MAG: YdeI/OmpD-associated family protein [Saprospiraceae bacterium]|nr:YdeI/OmpD-associated family protein [Saprospiraceae bacterium]